MFKRIDLKDSLLSLLVKSFPRQIVKLQSENVIQIDNNVHQITLIQSYNPAAENWHFSPGPHYIEYHARLLLARTNHDFISHATHYTIDDLFKTLSEEIPKYEGVRKPIEQLNLFEFKENHDE